ncbi:MAG: amidohydrolase [Thermodesulfobacteriota bacterium]
MDKGDLGIINGKVITVDPRFNVKQAIAVKNGRIAAVGANEEIKALLGPGVRVLDLKGRTILPGINESHMHGAFFGGTRPPLALDLTFPNVKTIGEMVAVLRDKVKTVKPGEWIRGFGWDQGSIEECKNDPNRLPRKYDLDPVSPDHPVVFTDFSAHTLLANSKALKLAGVTKDTPDPEGGKIERDPATGEPTGIFLELSAQALMHKVVPLYTKAQKREAVLSVLKHLKANGVTSFTEAALGPGGDAFVGGVLGTETIGVYKDLHDEGALTARVNILLLMGEYGAVCYEDVKKGLEAYVLPSGLDPEWLRMPGLKVFADGIPLTKTSWMHEEYVGGGRGTLAIPGETDEKKYNELLKIIAYAHGRGLQVGVHATGDRAIDAAVDGFIKAMQGSPRSDPRHYVIHGDFITPACARRAAQYRIGVAMQPVIQAMIADFEVHVVGPERAAYEWPMRLCLDEGINLTANSDAPVTYPNWREGVQCAVLRESKVSGQVSGPEQRVSVAEAIRMYTINGAWQDHMENIKGSIEPGKLADFCIIGEDILSVDPRRIGQIPVLMTIAGGKVVFDESGGAFD